MPLRSCRGQRRRLDPRRSRLSLRGTRQPAWAAGLSCRSRWWITPAERALRGFGRCPTLSSLTLVIYVSGFGFSDGTSIDFDPMTPAAANAAWLANFTLTSPTNRWKNVTSELLRAFVVPGTYQPGCAFPEVSDACDLQISGLSGMTVSTGSTSGNFGFAASPHSPLLGTPLTVLGADRAWGGNEGPVTWRATGDALAGGSLTATYPFAGTTVFKMPLGSSPIYNATSQTLTWPTMPALTCSGVSGLTVLVRDAKANTLQTFTINLSGFTVSAPTINDECDHRDGATPTQSVATWATDTTAQVLPCYYMSLANRLAGDATQPSPDDSAGGRRARNRGKARSAGDRRIALRSRHTFSDVSQLYKPGRAAKPQPSLR